MLSMLSHVPPRRDNTSSWRSPCGRSPRPSAVRLRARFKPVSQRRPSSSKAVLFEFGLAVPADEFFPLVGHSVNSRGDVVPGRLFDLRVWPDAMSQHVARRGLRVCTGARLTAQGLSAVCGLLGAGDIGDAWAPRCRRWRQPVRAPATPTIAGAWGPRWGVTCRGRWPW